MWHLKYDTNEPNYETETESWTQRMGKQQGPTVEHRELYSISCDKPEWKRIFHKENNVYICITESLCCTTVINTTL